MKRLVIEIDETDHKYFKLYCARMGFNTKEVVLHQIEPLIKEGRKYYNVIGKNENTEQDEQK